MHTGECNGVDDASLGKHIGKLHLGKSFCTVINGSTVLGTLPWPCHTGSSGG